LDGLLWGRDILRRLLKDLLARPHPAAGPDGDDLAAHVNHAAALLAAGATQQAIEACRRALAIDPRSAHALTNLGLALLNAGGLEEAQRSAERALEAQADFLPACTLLGDILLARARP